MVHPLELLQVRSLKRLSEPLERFLKTRLWAQILVGLALGVGFGVALGPSVGWVEPASAKVIGDWVALPGRLFLLLIQMVVVPLVFASVIRGIAASEDLEQLKKLGLRVGVYFVATTTVAISIGLLVALIVRPGRFIDVGATAGLAPATDAPATPTLAELPQQLLGLLPENPLNAMVETQMLQVVLFAIVLGAALVSLAPKSSLPLLELLGSLQDVCMAIVRWALWLAPFAVFGLIAQLVMQTGVGVLVGMAAYVGSVIGGLLLLVGFYLALVALVARRSPLAFLAAIREVQLLAFSTSSSAAVMPLSMRTADEKLKVRPSISQLVVPLGATINMDGTALYQGVATVFLAQAFGMELGVAGLAVLIVTAVGASIGAPGTPGVGVVLLAMILSSVGIPPSGVALILGVDRILDMIRTAVNVTGDMTACVVMDRWVGGKRTAEEELATLPVVDHHTSPAVEAPA